MAYELEYALGLIYSVIVWIIAYVKLAKKDYIAAAPLSQATSLAVGGITLYMIELLATWSPHASAFSLYMPPWMGAVVYGYTLGWLITALLTLAIVVTGIDIEFETTKLRRETR